MSNNSLPHIQSGINQNECNKNIVFHIQDRMTKYLKSPNGYDPDNKISKLRLTTVRLYLNNLVKFLKEQTPTPIMPKISQLNFILHSHIINGIAYDFPDRIYKVLYFLHEICNENTDVENLVKEWDSNTIYF